MIHLRPKNQEESAELSAALTWYWNLSFQQQEFLSSFYATPVSSSEHAIIIAYRDRDASHNHANWPAPTFRKI